MKFCSVLLVVVNALGCMAAHTAQLGIGLEPGCNDLQKGLLVGTPMVLPYVIPPQVPNAYVNLPRDFYASCPHPNGVYVKSCEQCPNCVAPTISMTFERGPEDRIDVYRSNGALSGSNDIQVTVYCSP